MRDFFEALLSKIRSSGQQLLVLLLRERLLAVKKCFDDSFLAVKESEIASDDGFSQLLFWKPANGPINLLKEIFVNLGRIFFKGDEEIPRITNYTYLLLFFIKLN